MKKKLQEAVKQGDLSKIRAILVEIVTDKSAGTSSIEDVTEIVAGTEGLFEPDDGKFYAHNSKQLNSALLEALHADIKENFSLPKFTLLAEAHQILRDDPHYYGKRESQLGGTISDAAFKAETDAQIEREQEETRKNPGRVMARRFGYIVLICGMVAAIVGICVPVHFLVGLGIGVLMLGAAVVYTSLPHN